MAAPVPLISSSSSPSKAKNQPGSPSKSPVKVEYVDAILQIEVAGFFRDGRTIITEKDGRTIFVWSAIVTEASSGKVAVKTLLTFDESVVKELQAKVRKLIANKDVSHCTLIFSNLVVYKEALKAASKTSVALLTKTSIPRVLALPSNVSIFVDPPKLNDTLKFNTIFANLVVPITGVLMTEEQMRDVNVDESPFPVKLFLSGDKKLLLNSPDVAKVAFEQIRIDNPIFVVILNATVGGHNCGPHEEDKLIVNFGALDHVNGDRCTTNFGNFLKLKSFISLYPGNLGDAQSFVNLVNVDGTHSLWNEFDHGPITDDLFAGATRRQLELGEQPGKRSRGANESFQEDAPDADSEDIELLRKR